MRSILAAGIVAAAVTSVLAGTDAASAAPRPAVTAAAVTGGAYVPVTPTRVVNQTVAAHAKVTRTLGAYAGAGGVLVTLTAIGPTGNGSLVAFGGAGSAPGVSSLQLTAHQKSADTTLVQPDASGRISVVNNSTGSVALLVDVTGYYAGGASSSVVKSYHPVAPKRVMNTTTGAGGNRDGALNPKGGANPRIWSGNSGLPASGGVGAVAVTITDLNARAGGYLTAGAFDLPIAPEAALHWAPGQRVSSFAIVPVDADGYLALSNQSGGTVDIEIDVLGWFAAGSPQASGMLNNVPAARVYDTRSGGTFAAGSTRTIALTGKGGIAKAPSTVRAVELTIAAIAPSTTGGLVAWTGGTPRPGTTNLQFYAGHTTSNVALVPVSSTGTISLYNGSSGSVDVVVDVTGWVLDDAVDVPATQVGRYVQNLSPTDTATNATTMGGEGKQDKNSDLVLLDIGAQLNNKTGVQLALTGTNLTYDTLVKAMQAYVNAYADAGGNGTVAIGTNNDAADWTAYPAAARGADWANKVIDQIDAPSGVTIAAADDIEPSFGTGKVTDAQGWKQAYLAATTHPLIFNGSADDCPVDYNKPGATCKNGWTEWDLYRLASGTRTTALPQIYNSRLAIQWANIDQTGRAMGQSGLVYAGALTEHPFDGSYEPADGYSALTHSLSTIVATPKIPAVVSLHADAPVSAGILVR